MDLYFLHTEPHSFSAEVADQHLTSMTEMFARSCAAVQRTLIELRRVQLLEEQMRTDKNRAPFTEWSLKSSVHKLNELEALLSGVPEGNLKLTEWALLSEFSWDWSIKALEWLAVEYHRRIHSSHPRQRQITGMKVDGVRPAAVGRNMFLGEPTFEQVRADRVRYFKDFKGEASWCGGAPEWWRFLTRSGLR